MDEETAFPTIEDARSAIIAATGLVPLSIKRFPTGIVNFVFEIAFHKAPALVLRMTTQGRSSAMADAQALSDLLRPMGVPLPKIVSSAFNGPFPFLLLERLEGADLGKVIDRIPRRELGNLARSIAQAQAITARLPSARRYGYASRATKAPHESWQLVLQENLDRSARRLRTAGLFDVSCVNVVRSHVLAVEEKLAAIPATPFLHDTTTKNVIVQEDGTFSGIVDVDDLCFGDPRQVVALTAASLLVSGGPMRYVEEWLAAAHFEDDSLFRLYVAISLVDFMAEHGQFFNGNQVPSSPEERAHLECVFKDCLVALKEARDRER